MISSKNILLSSLALLVGASLAFSSCSSEPGLKPSLKPKTPTDETLNKNHDLPSKVVVTLARGHFHGKDFHGNPEIEGVKIYNANLQTITFESTPQGLKPTADSPKVFVVMGGRNPEKTPQDPATANWRDDTFGPSTVAAGLWQYALIVKMYAQNGDEITGQFATPEESRIHQMFFIPKNIKSTRFGDQSRVFNPDYTFLNYYYMDTDPWTTSLHEVAQPLKERHASAEEIDAAQDKVFKGVSNPIGLKGFVEFYEPNTAFDLNIAMMHARVNKFIDGNGKTSPFYKPSARQRSGDDWNDLNITVPFVVYGHAYDDSMGDAETYEEMSEAEKRILDKLADAYGIAQDDEEGRKTLFMDLYNSLRNVKPEDINAGIHL